GTRPWCASSRSAARRGRASSPRRWAPRRTSPRLGERAPDSGQGRPEISAGKPATVLARLEAWRLLSRSSSGSRPHHPVQAVEARPGGTPMNDSKEKRQNDTDPTPSPLELNRETLRELDDR